jgi:hypothetical protein
MPDKEATMDGGMEDSSFSPKTTQGLTEKELAETGEKPSNPDAEIIIRQICENTGATREQVYRAIQRANSMEKEGKVKSNFLKLVEAISATIAKEDLLKNNTPDEFYPKEKTPQEKKKKLIRQLYAN